MHITRIEVEDGFLDGLQVSFEQGLNVVIGPRGSGKTSLVELMRYALGAEPLTERARGSLRDTIAAVLKDGQVTVTLENDDGELITATRGADDDEPRTTGAYRAPVVFAQNEIESIGLSPSSRLSLLDRFRSHRADDARAMAAARATLQSVTAQIQGLSDELGKLLEQASSVNSLVRELEEAELEERRLLESVAATQPEQDRLRSLQETAAHHSVRETILRRSAAAIDVWAAEFDGVRSRAPRLEQLPGGRAANSLVRASAEIVAIQTVLGDQTKRLTALTAQLEDEAAKEGRAKGQVDADSTTLRHRLDEVQQGAGAITRRVQLLKERVAQSRALATLADSRRAQLESLNAERRKVYAQLEQARRQRFEARSKVAARLSRELAPHVRVEVAPGAIDASYRAAIEAGLRGSGMHTKSLVPALAENLSPVELAEAAEKEDASRVATAAGVTLERAVRALQSLRAAGTESLVATELEDGVTFSLLDGKDYKTTDKLSTGQRCTVVLAIVLSSKQAVVVIDQPEDHLDNAYVVDTLVKTIGARSATAQTIATTHNPNIPVLGDARQVTVLGSDGSRGFQIQTRPLLDPASISQITRLMEGGREAFRRRAITYGLG